MSEDVNLPSATNAFLQTRVTDGSRLLLKGTWAAQRGFKNVHTAL